MASCEPQKVRVVTDMDSQGPKNIPINVEPHFPKLVPGLGDELMFDSNSETEGLHIARAINDNNFLIGCPFISGSHLNINIQNAQLYQMQQKLVRCRI